MKVSDGEALKAKGGDQERAGGHSVMGRRNLKEPAKQRVLTFNIAWTSKAKLIRGTARHICLHVFVSASLSRRPLSDRPRSRPRPSSLLDIWVKRLDPSRSNLAAPRLHRHPALRTEFVDHASQDGILFHIRPDFRLILPPLPLLSGVRATMLSLVPAKVGKLNPPDQ